MALEREEMLQVIEGSIVNCERAQHKFADGSAQYSLLRNRLAALRIARELLLEMPVQHTRAELETALPPLASIASKCGKGRQKHAAHTPAYRRLTRLIDTADCTQALVRAALERLEDVPPRPVPDERRDLQ